MKTIIAKHLSLECDTAINISSAIDEIWNVKYQPWQQLMQLVLDESILYRIYFIQFLVII